jgi:hypothetical protein
MIRAISIIVGVMASLTVHNIGGISDTYSFIVGVGFYFGVRVVFRVVQRNRQFRRELDRLVEDHKQGKPLIDDEGRRIL